MPLQFLPGFGDPSDADLVRLFHRSDAAWTGHLAEGEALDVGMAYANASLPNVWNANNVRDAALPRGTTPAAAVETVDAYYAARGAACAYWIMHPSVDAAHTGPLAGYLLGVGHRARRDEILHLRRRHDERPAEPEGLRVLPARTSYRHARMLAEERARDSQGGRWIEERVESDILHVDDPNTQTLIALKDDRPVATISVLAADNVGQIESVYVARPFRGRGIGRAMMRRALDACAHSTPQHVFILVDPENTAAAGLYRSCGFEPVGELTSYCAPALYP